MRLFLRVELEGDILFLIHQVEETEIKLPSLLHEWWPQISLPGCDNTLKALLCLHPSLPMAEPGQADREVPIIIAHMGGVSAITKIIYTTKSNKNPFFFTVGLKIVFLHMIKVS